MRSRLQQAGLWCEEEKEKDPVINMSFAWSILAKLGFPARYGGRAQDGSYEYVIIDPQTGKHLATGRGENLEISMCEAAINVSSIIEPNKRVKTLC